jgi:hypothetical protein
MSATTELSTALRSAGPSLRLLQRSLSVDSNEFFTSPASDVEDSVDNTGAGSAASGSSPTSSAASSNASASRRRRADALPSRAAIDAAFEEMSQQIVAGAEETQTP